MRPRAQPPHVLPQMVGFHRLLELLLPPALSRRRRRAIPHQSRALRRFRRLLCNGGWNQGKTEKGKKKTTTGRNFHAQASWNSFVGSRRAQPERHSSPAQPSQTAEHYSLCIGSRYIWVKKEASCAVTWDAGVSSPELRSKSSSPLLAEHFPPHVRPVLLHHVEERVQRQLLAPFVGRIPQRPIRRRIIKIGNPCRHRIPRDFRCIEMTLPIVSPRHHLAADRIARPAPEPAAPFHEVSWVLVQRDRKQRLAHKVPNRLVGKRPAIILSKPLRPLPK